MSESCDAFESIVCGAVELASPEERAAYIGRHCAGNAELQNRIESLVEACLRAGNFLETPAFPALDAIPSESAGHIIGPYKLLQQIGEGGMGVVFMAEQSRPVHRYVALKIIKPGMDTRQVIARFEAERQALAMMDHPNIAKVLDAGAAESGRPYFVMELVKGVPITRYCDERRLTPRRRLELFVQVCQAVHHAHQKGIVHRDLKPSNVQVADYDDQPTPKIIDFGVAKAISQPLTERTLFTEYGQIIGTFEYMSPEQAKLNQLDIDTRTDVYSLGVLLYELLTGSTPLGRERLRSAALGEILRMIGEEDPPTPSTRLSASDTLPAISDQRQSDPKKLTSVVRGDLDWVAMKCLEKDRNRRYQSASDLAADVQRYLSDQPIEARGPSRVYRVQKFVRRNRVGVLAAAAVASAVAIGFAASIVGFARARTEAVRSRETARLLEDMLSAAGPRVARGRDATLLREILDLTAERIETELQGNPEIEGDVATILANTYHDIGQNERAVAMHQRAISCYRIAPGGDNTKLAIALGDLGCCQVVSGRPLDLSTARSNAARGLEMARRCGDREALASCLASMAYACNAFGLMSREGEPYLREELALRRALGTNRLATASCMRRLGQTLLDAEGDQLLQEALEIYQAELGDDAPQTIACIWAIGQRELQRGELAKAEQSLQRTFDAYVKTQGWSHHFTGIIWRQLATALAAQGKWEAAEDLARPGKGELPRNANQWDLLGKISAYRGDWSAAADRLTQARAAGNYREINRLAVALLTLGRRDEYRKLCAEAVSGKHISTAVEADAAAAYLLLPAEESTLSLARQWSVAAISSAEGKTLSTRKRLNKALALHRLGQFQQALQMTEPPDVEGESPASHAVFSAIQALSYAELRRPAEARTALRTAHRLAAREDRQWQGDPLEDVFNWQIAELLTREAEQLLGAPASSAPSSSMPLDAPSDAASVQGSRGAEPG